MPLRYCASILVLFVLVTARAAAQASATGGVVSPAGSALFDHLVLPSSGADEAVRLRSLRSDSTAWSMIRTTRVVGRGSAARPFAASVILPSVETTYNSTLPFTMNDGSVWAGRGWSGRLIAGATASLGSVTVVIAPELAYTQNDYVRVVGSGDTGRSQFASPFRRGTPYYADLPLRFGVDPIRMVSTGQSRVEVRHGALAGGASSEDQWWGPGARNALVLSNNAPGIPHLYVRTAQPWRTRLGELEARWLVGGLTESIFFDRDPENDLRSLSALAATMRFAAEPGLTLGIARAVYAPVSGAASVPGRAFDVLTRWAATTDSTSARQDRQNEQIISFFGRWHFSEHGVELYGEWARQRLPRSFRDLLVAPQSSQAYTLGMQGARPAGAGTLRGHVEITTLEQTPLEFRGPVHSFYVSRLVPQGYTHRGQAVGAAIGPGSSSQWTGVDYMRTRWELGLNLGRIRWDNDAYYQQETGRERYSHDVSLMAGARGAVRLQGLELRGEVIRMHRLNYLFQNINGGYIRDRSFEFRNTTVRLNAGFTP